MNAPSQSFHPGTDRIDALPVHPERALSFAVRHEAVKKLKAGWSSQSRTLKCFDLVCTVKYICSSLILSKEAEVSRRGRFYIDLVLHFPSVCRGSKSGKPSELENM